jgi:hypothetical protein
MFAATVCRDFAAVCQGQHKNRISCMVIFLDFYRDIVLQLYRDFAASRQSRSKIFFSVHGNFTGHLSPGFLHNLL